MPGTRTVLATVVSHTHWDREWYLPFERFRLRLIKTVDQALDLLDHEPSFQYFTLDGQTVVLEDYLQIRPENRERLARHIRGGRLLIGPWYVLPDEFLVTPESLVRNLLLGRQMGRDFGGIMEVGYLPDTFGHPAQLPQILAGFGLDTAVIFRGVQTDAAQFIWEAPDGSRVFTHYLVDGYCTAMDMILSPKRFLQNLEGLVERQVSLATTDHLLIMSGCDHLAPQRNLQLIVEAANEMLAGDGNGRRVEFAQGTLPQFLDALRKDAQGLAVVSGEYRFGRPARITPGVLSARTYMKQENMRASAILERYAEPLSALAWSAGQPYPRGLIGQAWKYVLQCHAHDSICGCSTDNVHRDVMSRLRWSQEIAWDLAWESLEALARRVDPGDDDVAQVLLFNPCGRPRSDYARLAVQFLASGSEFHLTDEQGNPVAYQVLGRRPVNLTYRCTAEGIELNGHQSPTIMGILPSEYQEVLLDDMVRTWRPGEEVDLLLQADVPACGYATYRLVPGAASDSVATDLRAGENWLENDLVRVEVRPNGTVDLLDKGTGVAYTSLNLFEDSGDAGDEYNYSPPAQDEVVTSAHGSAEVRLVELGPVRATLAVGLSLFVPRRLDADRQRRSEERVDLPITYRISLAAGSPRVEFRVELDNQAEDHRLRVVFPTPVRTDVVHSLGQFEVVTRLATVDPVEAARPMERGGEKSVATHPQRDFLDVNDGRVGLTVLNRGLTEYEGLPTPDGTGVAITLIRAVGWLSRPDLTTRFGDAGPNLLTPEAQCRGTQVFEYAVVPHPGGWAEAGIAHETDRYVAPMLASSLHRSRGGLARRLAAIEVEPAELVLSAVKKAEDADALIIRVYNVAEQAVQGRVKLAGSASDVRLVGLNEQDLGEPALVADADGVVTFPVGKQQIRTLRIS